MNKKLFWIIGIVVLIVLLIISCSIKLDDETTSDLYNTLENATKEAANIKTNEQKEFIEISIDEYLNKYNEDKKTLILIARPTCHYCQIAEPILHNIAYKYNLNINYLNTDSFHNDDKQKFMESNEYFKNGFGTPMLLVVSEGKINDMVDGVTDTSNYIEFLKRNRFIN